MSLSATITLKDLSVAVKAANVEGVPKSVQGLQKWVKAKGFIGLPIGKIGGGFTYEVSLFPSAVQRAVANLPLLESTDGSKNLDIAIARKRIVQYWNSWAENHKDGRSKLAMRTRFSDLYNAGVLEISSEVYALVPSISVPTLTRYCELVAKKKSLEPKYGAQKGKGILEDSEDGEIYKAILGLITANDFFTAGHIRDRIRTHFCPNAPYQINHNGKMKDLPNIRTFERVIYKIKEQHRVSLLSIQNPDKSRSKHQFAFGTGGVYATKPNAIWEFDASPADVLTLDGRLNLYALIDLHTRRAKILITSSARTSAALKLIRLAITDWGMPEQITTDNGSDFTSHDFKLTLKQCGIVQDISPPYTPQHKGFVERFIGTVQHGLFVQLNGYIGKDTTDAKQIRDRKSFAARLGEDDAKAFKVEMTQQDLQEACDVWVEGKYHVSRHKGIGMTPQAKANAYDGEIVRCTDSTIIKRLFAPLAKNPTRQVINKGVRVKNRHYGADEMAFYAGKRVYVRENPEDAGTIYLFDIDTAEYICEAICPEFYGLSRQYLAESMLRTGNSHMKKERQQLRKYMDATDHKKGMNTEGQMKVWEANIESTEKTEHEYTQAFETAAEIENDKVKSLAKFKASLKRAAEIEKLLYENRPTSDGDKKFILRVRNTPEYKVRVLPLLKFNPIEIERKTHDNATPDDIGINQCFKT